MDAGVGNGVDDGAGDGDVLVFGGVEVVEVVQVYQRDPHSNPHLAVCTWTKKQYINALIIYVLNTQFENRLLTSKLGRNMCYSAVRVRQ